jgi:hypothetical protein
MARCVELNVSKLKHDVSHLAEVCRTLRRCVASDSGVSNLRCVVVSHLVYPGQINNWRNQPVYGYYLLQELRYWGPEPPDYEPLISLGNKHFDGADAAMRCEYHSLFIKLSLSVRPKPYLHL